MIKIIKKETTLFFFYSTEFKKSLKIPENNSNTFESFKIIFYFRNWEQFKMCRMFPNATGL